MKFYTLCLLALSLNFLGAEEPEIYERSQEKYLTSEQFDSLTDDLRSTLTGDPVTVLRSEWKTKLSLEDSNLYLQQLLERFLSNETRDAVLKDLDLSDVAFSKKVSERFGLLQKDGKLTEKDRINIRDQGPQRGVVDSTFTYYTRPLADEKGVAKHQIRLRSYLRRINLAELEKWKPCTAYTQLGEKIKITKMTDSQFNIVSTVDGSSTKAKLCTKQMHELYGNPIILYSIPGGTFKFEVKTALKDVISAENHPLLGGNHMVQKLDINGVTFEQLAHLFDPSSSDLKGRIEHLKEELTAKNPELQERIRAIFSVVHQGVENYGPDFLMLEGVTHYQRSAFGGASGFQTTFDREQEVYWKNIYHPEGLLKDPKEVILTSKCYIPKIHTERHVELKFPYNAVESTIGLTPYQPHDLTDHQDNGVDSEFFDAAVLYQQYPGDFSHQGKFKYLIENGVLKP